MREFSTTVNNALANGLQPNESFRDTEFFAELYNLVPFQQRASLRPYEAVIDVLQLDHQASMYPFPQWFRFENDNVLIANNDLNAVDDNYLPFDIQHKQVTEWEIGTFTEPFRAVDYGDNWILLNRDGVIYKKDGRISASKRIKASALLKHRNRTLIGGSTHGMWSDEWKTILEEMFYNKNVDSDLWTTSLGNNFVLWSSFDSTDIPFGLLEPDKLFEGFDTNLFIENLYSNQLGFMEMPFTGAVLDMHSALDQVFVFGENGIASMAMVPDSPGAGFVETGRQPFGIKSRGAVGGDEDSFVFIDAENNLWYGSRQGIQKLDYHKYMAELTGQIYIHKDPDHNRFYIGDQNRSFVLNELRLSRVFQTIIQIDGGYPFKAGVTYETGGKHAALKTEGLDIGVPDLKTLTGIHLSTDEPFKARARASAQVHGKEVETPLFIVNQEGYTATRLFGKNQEIEVFFENYENVYIDGIELKWQIDDSRQRRGFFATQDATGAG